METKAHHVVIGAFILATVAAAFGFIIWLAKVDIDRETRLYDIYFEDSVSGLTTSSSVLYKGVKVGDIERIRIDPNDPARVKVRVKILASTPIREDAIATLAIQGITGVSNIEIEGGTAEAAPLAVREGQEYPVIDSKPSVLQELLGGAPDLINEVGLFIKDLQLMVSAENRKAMENILANLDEITGGMAIRAELINRIIENMDTTMAQMASATATWDKVGQEANTLIATDMRDMVQNIRSAAQSVDGLATQLDDTVGEQRGSLTDFTQNTLPEVGRLISDARRLTDTLNRVADQIEDNPSEFLFTPPPPEYRPN